MAKQKPKTKRIRQLKEGLSLDHYVVARSAKTNQKRKFRSDVNLVLEVYSKKTKKRVGVLNEVKNGKPVPRKFARGQKAYLSRVKRKRRSRNKKELDSFEITYKKPILDQIPDRIVDGIQSVLRSKDIVVFDLEVTTTKENALTKEIFYTDEVRPADIRRDMASFIFQTLTDLNIRMSPKKFARYKKKTMRRSAQVAVRYKTLG